MYGQICVCSVVCLCPRSSSCYESSSQSGCRSAVQQTSDNSIFAFALNLEYLESDFYSWMVYVRVILPVSCLSVSCAPCADFLRGLEKSK